jgi:subtilisin family serine protease
MMMKKLTRFALLLTLSALPALAANRFILRPMDNTSVDNVCDRHGLTIVSQLDTHNNVFLVTASDVFSATDVITDVSGDSDVVAIEEDRTLSTPEVNAAPSLNQSTTAILDQISTRTVISYFGQTLPTFYAAQPALTQLDLTNAQQKLGAVGAGIVAIIDTGIDPNHPVLKNSIVAGFDFTRNIPGNASEFADLDQSTTAILDQSTTAILDQSTTAILDGLGVAVLNQSTTAILDQSTTAILDTTKLPAAFGHGTMVAGIVHLAAPSAQIMPLKAFTADGHGDLADIVRAIYYAADHGCSVINMSFSLSDPSPSLKEAIGYAQDAGCISIASTGNTGLAAVGYPAATPKVIAVASEDATGNRSLFSTFGTPTWVAAPGEQIVTTYPGNHWAVVSGTSFSAPFVSGGAALLKQFAGGSGYSKISKAFSLRRKYTSDLGYGNADLGQSLTWLINNP